MTLSELEEKYHSFSVSTDSKSKLKAKGYRYDTEPVMISMISERYINTQEKIYRATKKEEYRQKVLAARECVIRYATSDEISILLSHLNFDDKSLTNYLNYLKGAGYMDRIKYEDFLSAYNLLIL